MNTLNLVDRPATTTVVGMHITTKPLSPEIPALWPTFVARMGEIRNAAEPRVTYGVMISGNRALEYTAAISVTSATDVPAGMSVLELPAGHYALFKYPLSGLGKGFREIFETLLPQSGYVHGLGPHFERYNEDFCPDKPESLVEIWIPVAKRVAR